MHTRIKYEFNGPIGISRQSFKIKGKDVRIVVNKNDFYFELVDNKGDVIVKGGKTKNYAVLLRQAKRALGKLGHKFDTETRDRDYGVIRKEGQTN
jgi:hypothetical protein